MCVGRGGVGWRGVGVEVVRVGGGEEEVEEAVVVVGSWVVVVVASLICSREVVFERWWWLWCSGGGGAESSLAGLLLSESVSRDSYIENALSLPLPCSILRGGFRRCLEEDRDAVIGSNTHLLLFSGVSCVEDDEGEEEGDEGWLRSRALFSPPPPTAVVGIPPTPPTLLSSSGSSVAMSLLE